MDRTKGWWRTAWVRGRKACQRRRERGGGLGEVMVVGMGGEGEAKAMVLDGRKEEEEEGEEADEEEARRRMQQQCRKRRGPRSEVGRRRDEASKGSSMQQGREAGREDGAARNWEGGRRF